MREAVVATILVAAAGAAVYFMPAGLFGSGGEYPLTVREAQTLLNHADLRKGQLPFGTLAVRRSSPRPGELRFAAGNPAALDCRAILTAVGDRGVDVVTRCKPGDPRRAGLAEPAFAEYVAAVLGKRQFDENRLPPAAAMAGTAPGSLDAMQPRPAQAAGPAADDKDGAADDIEGQDPAPADAARGVDPGGPESADRTG
ncbi:MAG: hypothetical protein P0Y56_03940 [Candidatus Andeanibacterium colombiense]|uniref:Uncharacterized protein n=1 Tax=Candidatus Andeanibacterium colombiense TaxID=3121345 RepID=A0AAJ5X7P2_9SPHN|nr:MAG: hypothetical protein P0Y56_03940 [Sphingomonadaceae bacterium]